MSLRISIKSLVLYFEMFPLTVLLLFICIEILWPFFVKKKVFFSGQSTKRRGGGKESTKEKITLKKIFF